jgi:hypothetical protein
MSEALFRQLNTMPVKHRLPQAGQTHRPLVATRATALHHLAGDTNPPHAEPNLQIEPTQDISGHH